MAKESMNLGESFSAHKVGGMTATPKPPRYAGWAAALAALGASAYYFLSGGQMPTVMQERPGLTETFQHKIGGILTVQQVRAGSVINSWGPFRNTIVNAGETALRDCFGGTGTPTCTPVQNFKYHGIGTSAAAIAEADTGCTTELTTQYNPDSTRATGSQTNNGANIYRTVGTNTVDASVTVNEFCLMSQAATGGGTMWTRILTGAIALNSGDSLQTTYDLTIE